MKLVFLGPPGSGKGTYSKRISPVLKIPQISTGDIFRSEIKNETELGLKVKSLIDAGQFVSDEIVLEIVKKRLTEDDAKEGFILDGFPRTIPQAEGLLDITELDAVVNINVPEDILISRLTSRRTCKKCGKIYNLLNIKPKQEGICDDCGGELFHRDDDKIEVIKDRLDVYKKQTQPLIEFYQKKGLIIDIVNDDINIPPEPVVERILDKLKNVKK